MFVLLLILLRELAEANPRWALSSVGRASPLQGEGQKFESSSAHHKRDDDICYHLFYFECFDSEKLLLKFERGASRVRRNFAKWMKFIEAKSVDTFNASDSRQSSNAHHYKQRPILKSVFLFVELSIYNLFNGSEITFYNELRCELIWFDTIYYTIPVLQVLK